MTNEKMIEMMEFFEMYEMFKAMKSKSPESARTNVAVVENANNVNTFYNNNNIVQRGTEVVNLGESVGANDVATKFEAYELEVDGKKYYCIKSGICTSKKVVDKFTGQEKIKHFNISAKQLANDMIKAVDGILTLKVPFTNKKGEWSAWGFKTKKKCAEVVASLPKVVKGEDIDAKNKEYQAKKGGQ